MAFQLLFCVGLHFIRNVFSQRVFFGRAKIIAFFQIKLGSGFGFMWFENVLHSVVRRCAVIAFRGEIFP